MLEDNDDYEIFNEFDNPHEDPDAAFTNMQNYEDPNGNDNRNGIEYGYYDPNSIPSVIPPRAFVMNPDIQFAGLEDIGYDGTVDPASPLSEAAASNEYEVHVPNEVGNEVSQTIDFSAMLNGGTATAGNEIDA